MPGPGGDEGTSLASNSLLNLPALTASGSFSSSCSLSSKTRARKARKISEREWERLKPKILESRATRTVPEVAIDMRTRFGFKATERQLKSRLEKWGAVKNIKNAEMKAIVRKQQHRRLVQPEKRDLHFVLRGRHVPQEKIDRFMKREGITDDDLYAPESGGTTPDREFFDCWTARGTPSPSIQRSSTSSDTIGEDVLQGHLLTSQITSDDSGTQTSNSTDAMAGDVSELSQASQYPFYNYPLDSSNAHEDWLPDYLDSEPLKEGWTEVQSIETLTATASLEKPASELSIAQIPDIPSENPKNWPDALDEIPYYLGGYNVTIHPSFPMERFENIANDGQSNPIKHHRQRAVHCLRTMSIHLQENICKLASPGMAGDEVDTWTKSTVIPEELKYACLHWADHLQQGGEIIKDGDLVHLFLKRSFLHWLEVLSLVGELYKGSQVINTALSILATGHSDTVSNFLRDAKQFIHQHFVTMNTWPLQIYYSALLFSPDKSIIKQLFADKTFAPMPKVSGLSTQWGSWSKRLEGHSNSITAVAYSHDSTLIASASYDNTVKIWSTATGICLRTLKCLFTGFSLEFSHDSELLAVVGRDCGITIWNTKTWEHLQLGMTHGGAALAIAFAGDSSFIASLSYRFEDSAINLWNPVMGECIRRLVGHSTKPNAIAVSSNSRLLASCADEIKLWDTTTGVCLHTIKDSNHTFQGVAISHDSNRIAFFACGRVLGEKDMKEIRIWDMKTNDYSLSIPTERSCSTISFSHDSQLLLTSLAHRNTCTWDAATGQALCKFKGSFSAFSSDSRFLASAFMKGVRIWDSRTRLGVDRHEHAGTGSAELWRDWKDQMTEEDADATSHVEKPYGMCHDLPISPGFGDVASQNVISPDAAHFTSHVFKSRIWRTADGHCRDLPRNDMSRGDFCFAFSHDSRFLVYLSHNADLSVWDVDGQKIVRKFGTYARPVPESCQLVPAHNSYALTLSFIKYGRAHIVQVSDFLKGKIVHTEFDVGGISRAKVNVAPNSRFVAVSHQDGIGIYERPCEKRLRTLRGHGPKILSLAFSSSSHLIAAASETCIKIWDVETGQCLHTLSIVLDVPRLSFDATDQFLHTNIGSVFLPGLPFLSVMPLRSCFRGYWLNTFEGWVMYRGDCLIRLPLDYRQARVITSFKGSTLVMTYETGRFVVLRFRDIY